MDFSSFLGSGQEQQGKGNSTAATIFGGYNSSQQLGAALPWLIGGAAVLAIAFAAIVIAAIRK